MVRPTFPKTLREFQSEFATEEACQKYLAACRRRQPMAAFQTLLGLGTGRRPTSYKEIRGGADLSTPFNKD